MSKTKEFNGDEYVELALNENQITDLDEILSFINNHENIYLFGNGKCGTGFSDYLNTCDFENIRGFITSNTWEKFIQNYKIHRDGMILTLNADYYREILPMMWGKIDKSDIFFIRERSKQIFIQTFSDDYLRNNFWLTLPMTRHCNINCSSCSMYAPLCQEEFYTLENIKKDMLKIKEIGLYLDRINISGGEPFLNPEALDILLYIRQLFPKLKIDIYTNGLPLLAFTDFQFEILKLCEAEIQVTEYNISVGKLDYVYKQFETHKITYRIDFFEGKKKFFRKTIDLEGKVAKTEYINCQYYTFAFSVFIYNGVLFKCATALNADIINELTNNSLEVSESDYLKLDSLNSDKQIYDFWRSRLNMCRYCPRVTETMTWKKSERKIEEWM